MNNPSKYGFGAGGSHAGCPESNIPSLYANDPPSGRCTRYMSRRERTTADAELDSALTTIDWFQNSIQHADTKVAVLLGVHGAVATYGVGEFVHAGEVAAA